MNASITDSGDRGNDPEQQQRQEDGEHDKLEKYQGLEKEP